ncbi:MAG TPA: hypothetical protein VFO05_10630 [Candidatus Limnocylindrales bacterium]|nr:hypothetical protein [Candidatus Limnocylindrales bacterium]
MTAATVATAPRVLGTWGRGPFVALALIVTLVAGVAIGALAVRAATSTEAATSNVGVTTHQPRVGPMAGSVAAPAVDPMADYARVVAGLNVAESRHDFAARARFESQLESVLTAETIGLIYQERARMMHALEEAQANGSGYGIYRITQDLNGLCGPAAVKASLTFCN